MTEHLAPETSVVHPEHGTGQVIVDTGATVVVRFGAAIHQVLRADLSEAPSLDRALTQGLVDPSGDSLIRATAMAIRSVNDQWGVFSRARVQLLPHQLWVCHKVNRVWPFRWLVADDVGLGKTIEAGLVLMPLIASGRIRRLLVLAPAKLVPQWQARMRKMFDIRMQVYDRAVDTPKVDFWDTANLVVASIHTLRGEVTDGRAEGSRFLAADPWDCVVVDEAHHLNADEQTGGTLSFQLLQAMEERRRIQSLLLFSGTPHRGKDFGFLSLLSLLRPGEFGPDHDIDAQLVKLSEVMIRNNKATVTDLKGNRLFTPITVSTREYQFSPEEEAFYRTLSEFIIEGRAYASSLDGRAQTARMLLLIALQKLAASSIASIRSALAKRRAKLAAIAEDARAARTIPAERDDDSATLDERAQADEEASSRLLAELMDGEVARLDELLALAAPITRERKIDRLVDLIDGELPPNEPVLLFTEYKATQALVVDALHTRFGHGCCGFINGDERLDDLARGDGTRGAKSLPRDVAADAFNRGDIRFLVSTEAAGEGIDLQERCATLIHVDMPWNPMRLHQRVGRLSRYGQTRPVQVFILRNPDTVEARIWDLLTAKLERIQRTLDGAMDEHEDIGQLVIGMTSPGSFERLFAEGQLHGREGLAQWFDKESATIGGEDLVHKVKTMLGNVTRFDFAQVGKNLPQVDLVDLERFFSLIMESKGRRIMRREDGLEVLTPEEWANEDYAMRDRYKSLIFDRSIKLGSDSPTRLVGIGHTLFDRALREGVAKSGVLACCQRLKWPLLLVSIEDEVTGQSRSVTRILAGAYQDEGGSVTVLRDWEVLRLLNGLGRSDLPETPFVDAATLKALEQTLRSSIEDKLGELTDMMTRPRLRSEMILLPENSSSLE